ncbi:hypothetical protein ACFX2I_038668 [Malus domestica]
MDGRGGCCIANYGYGGGGEYDMSKVDRIMLKFRPIAPRPVNGGGSTAEKGDVYVKSGRGRGKRSRCVKSKRRAVVYPNNKNNNKRKRPSKAEEEKMVVTLPLLPETPEPRESSVERERNSYSSHSSYSSTTWMSFENNNCTSRTSPTSHRSKVAAATAMGKSCITVDCVTDTWVEVEGLGCTDEERRMNLERDTCPGLISDWMGKVVWTNGAYRSMVGQREGEMMVWLVMKEKAARAVGVMSSYTAAFTCRVRVQYSGCGGGTSAGDWCSLTLPCDVWRMEGGGFAWRLDVKAALCLGAYSDFISAV